MIFVDEIDTTLSLDFTDDFFAAIRFLYVARATQPEFRRLSFVLIGVATPGDLIRDAKRTPFNVGKRVDLTDFMLAEAMPLAAGLGLAGAEAGQVLGWVLRWTSGHPYLTQRLCQEMAQMTGSPWTEAEVDRLVRRTFLGMQSEQDNNLQFVRDMLTKRAPEPMTVLQTYRQVWRGKPAVGDEEQSLVKSHLKLAGVVKREGKTLHVRNRIYRQVFDRRWIYEQESLWRRLKPSRWDGLFNGLIIVTWTINIALLVIIASRFLSGELDVLGIMAVVALPLLVLLQAKRFFTEDGQRSFSNFLERSNIPTLLHTEAKLALTSLLSIGLFIFWVQLPRISDSYSLRGLAYYREGAFSSAEKSYQRAIALNPDNVNAHYNLGRIYEDWSRFDEAKQEYQVAVVGDNFRAYNNLARLYILDKNYRAAVNLLLQQEELVKQQLSLPKDQQLIFKEDQYNLAKNLGWARFEQNRYPEAEAALQQAIAIAKDPEVSRYLPNRASAHCILAQVLERQGKANNEEISQLKQCEALGNSRDVPEEDTWISLAKQRLRTLRNHDLTP